ncbi:MAG: TIGR03667 family PPOX class F420-dependent oxidoreductase [Candidatus Dormibacteraeota bacterium]|nr:TIGR03667 family PPOX class F420-dependent oxidoreductase [Candidatus Dormibacteraeota bacterium]
MATTSWRLDPSSPFGQRVERRLREEPVIWLTTVDPDGTPQPIPVWFVWDGMQVLLYSEPGKPKLRNIERNPRVALHFDGDGRGGNVIVIRGEARIAPEMPAATEVPDYGRKYDAGGFYKRIGISGPIFATKYSVPIVIKPTGLRGH